VNSIKNKITILPWHPPLSPPFPDILIMVTMFQVWTCISLLLLF
jgi:hypothetical protein